MRKLMKFLGAGLFTVALSFLFMGLGAFPFTATAETAETTAFQMKTGASVRKVSPGGIRFTAQVAKDSYIDDATYGILVTPTDILGNKTLTHSLLEDANFQDEEGNSLILDIKASEWTIKDEQSAVWEYTGVIVNKDENGNLIDLDEQLWNRSLTAVGYYINGETITYTQNPQARSLAQTASLALQNPEDACDTLRAIVNRVLELDADSKDLSIASHSLCIIDRTTPLSLQGNEGLSAVWTTSDETIAAVDNDGVVSGVSVGTATITATIGTTAVSTEITVTDLQFTCGATESSASSETFSFELIHFENNEAVWTSSNTAVATVDNGTVTTLTEGTTTITATAESYTATATLTVDNRLPKSNIEYAISVTKDGTTYYAKAPVTSSKLLVSTTEIGAFKFKKAAGENRYYIYYDTETIDENTGNPIPSYVGHSSSTSINNQQTVWRLDMENSCVYSTADTTRALAISNDNAYLRAYAPEDYTPAFFCEMPEVNTDATDVAETLTELDEIGLPDIISENYVSPELPTNGTAHTGVAISWTVSENVCASLTDNVLTVNIPTNSTTIALTATVTSGEISQEKIFTITVVGSIKLTDIVTPMTMPKENTPYAAYAYYDGVPYFANGWNKSKWNATTATDAFMKMYFENATVGDVSGYYIYFYDGMTKTYITYGSSTNFAQETSTPDSVWLIGDNEGTPYLYDSSSNRFIGGAKDAGKVGVYDAKNLDSTTYPLVWFGEIPQTAASQNNAGIDSATLSPEFAENTFNSWTATSAKGDATTGANYLVMNTNSSLTSPIYTGGITNLSFWYGYLSEGTAFNFTVTINKEDGTAIFSKTVTTPTEFTQEEFYSLVWELPAEVEGNIIISIINNGEALAINRLFWDSVEDEVTIVTPPEVDGGETGGNEGGETPVSSTVSVIFSEQNYANAEAFSEFIFTNDNGAIATLSIAKNSGTQCKYYTDGTAIRIYNKNILSIVAEVGYKITKIEFTAVSNSYSIHGANVEDLSWLTNCTSENLGETPTVVTPVDGTQTISLHNSSESQWRIQSITITYEVVS